MYKQNLALNDLQRFIGDKTQPNQTKLIYKNIHSSSSICYEV